MTHVPLQQSVFWAQVAPVAPQVLPSSAPPELPVPPLDPLELLIPLLEPLLLELVAHASWHEVIAHCR